MKRSDDKTSLGMRLLTILSFGAVGRRQKVRARNPMEGLDTMPPVDAAEREEEYGACCRGRCRRRAFPWQTTWRCDTTGKLPEVVG